MDTLTRLSIDKVVAGDYHSRPRLSNHSELANVSLYLNRELERKDTRPRL